MEEPAAGLVAGDPPGVQGELGRQRRHLAGGIAYFGFMAIFPALIAGSASTVSSPTPRH
jgi:hypothetical protein